MDSGMIDANGKRCINFTNTASTLRTAGMESINTLSDEGRLRVSISFTPSQSVRRQSKA